MGWIIEIAKTLGYALVMSLVYVFVRSILPFINTSKATGWVLLRIQGYPLMLVGFFTIVLGFVLTRTYLVVGPDNRLHFTLR